MTIDDMDKNMSSASS